MKRVLTTIFVLSLALNLNAQFAEKEIDFAKKDKLNDYSNILDTDKISYKPGASSSVQNVKSRNLNMDFDYDKLSHFKILRRNSNKHSIWINGYVDQVKTMDWNSKVTDWLLQASRFIDLDLKKNNYTLLNSWSDDLNQKHSKLNKHIMIFLFMGLN